MTCERAAISGGNANNTKHGGKEAMVSYKVVYLICLQETVYFIHASGLFGFVLSLKVLDMSLICKQKNISCETCYHWKDYLRNLTLKYFVVFIRIM